MSADTISWCPKCCEETLREWHDMNLNADGTALAIKFRGRCRECGWSIDAIAAVPTVQHQGDPW